ncbi:MAG TPA: methylmalonyl Co-A mutase-associated GTPase MeaB, partial [Desulfobacteraceae bacterium]|nr:methylmalonyl Co-A mutase-associated GTPase MeaB [Desulfobacteraceae bacterium]
LVLAIAGAGDELQGIKKGVLELADAIAINKADGDNLERVKQTRADLEMAMHLVAPDSPSWHTPVLTCSSVTDGGTQNVWDTVLEHRKKMQATGEFDQRRRSQALEWMWTLVDEGMRRRFNENEKVQAQIPTMSARVENEKISPSAAARALLDLL